MKFSMTGQEKDDLLIEVTAQAGVTVYLDEMVMIMMMSALCYINPLRIFIVLAD